MDKTEVLPSQYYVIHVKLQIFLFMTNARIENKLKLSPP